MKHLLTLILCFSLLACKSDLTIEIGLTGNVVSDDGTIDCPDTCVREILDQETITLTASSNSEWYTFHHWEGACTGSDPTCTLDVHPLLPFNVKAQFAYTGKKLSDIEFEDPNLLECIKESAVDYLYKPAKLSTLNCPNRGIQSLAGIEQLESSIHFYFMLDGNQIVDLSPLEGQRFFRGLYLRNNAIVDPSPLINVSAFGGAVHLDGNPDLDCEIMRNMVEESPFVGVFWAPQCGIPEIVEIPNCDEGVHDTGEFEICISSLQLTESSVYSEIDEVSVNY